MKYETDELKAQIETKNKEISDLKDQVGVLVDAIEVYLPWARNCASMVVNGEIVRQNSDGTTMRFKDHGWFVDPVEAMEQAISNLPQASKSYREKLLADELESVYRALKGKVVTVTIQGEKCNADCRVIVEGEIEAAFEDLGNG